MRMANVIQLAKSYLGVGIIGALFFVAVFLIGYFVLYKKCMKGTKKLSFVKVCLFFLFFVYLTVVFGAVFASRVSHYQHTLNLQPFSSYREAWYTFSAVAWRNLILNILMFVPMGMLLPLLLKGCRRFWITYLAGFAASAGIEFVQFATHRGIVEFDDVFNNTLGTMIGYGMIAVMAAVAWRRKKEPAWYKKGTLALLQLPLILSMISFALIFGIYAKQELGNLRIVNYDGVNMSEILLSVECALSEREETQTVYRAEVLTKEETFDIAEDFFLILGAEVDGTSMDIYDETAVYKSKDGMHCIWVDYEGPAIWYTAFRLSEEEYMTDLSLNEITNILEPYHINIPDGAEISEADGRYIITAQMVQADGKLIDGTCSVDIVKGGRIASLNNRMIPYSLYKDFEVISEAAAYEQLAQGRFWQFSRKEVSEIAVTGVHLGYRIDSKGFYQPVYVFHVRFGNGEEGTAEVPALKRK